MHQNVSLKYYRKGDSIPRLYLQSSVFRVTRIFLVFLDVFYFSE